MSEGLAPRRRGLLPWTGADHEGWIGVPGEGIALRHNPLALVLRRPSERLVLSSVSLLAYLVIAVIVVLGAHSIIGDAWSRVGNAYYVLFSRDPHLAAIGFVWNPLPSLAVMPFLPLKFIWPDLVASGFSGCIVSALCMAGSVWQIHAIASDWHVRRSASLLVTILFAFNPMILYYGANGMSEAMFIFTLLLSVRYLARWSRTRQVVPLVVAGIAMAAAYMTRYEALVAAVAAFAAVVIISSTHRPGSLRHRVEEGFADGAVFITPVATSFVGWAVASWLIVRDPFQQFTSVYGVVSQLAVAQSQVAQITGQGTSSAYVWIARQMIGLEPGILILGLLALAATAKGRIGLTMPAVAILGAVVVFAVFGFLTGRTLGWLRYSITIIPLASVLALAVLAPNETAETAGRPAGSPLVVAWRRFRFQIPSLPVGPRRRLWASRAMGIAAVAIVAVAVPIGARTMLDPGENPQYGGEAFQLQPVLDPNAAPELYTPTGQYLVGKQASQYLDAMHLGNGAVLVDGAMGFPIILESNNPTQFITTSDRDFQQSLLDPVSFGVEYLLVPQAIGYQSLDAINRAYPGIYDHGANVASQLVAQFGSGGNNWRLYKVSP
jgi:Dolichyl-phosphate-mannose-protein mannosyltransferase